MGQRPWSEFQVLHQHLLIPRGALLLTYQKRTEHVKADEVHDGEVAPTRVLLPGVVIRLGVTELPREAGQHDLLPGLAGRTPFLERAKEGLLVGVEGFEAQTSKTFFLKSFSLEQNLRTLLKSQFELVKT